MHIEALACMELSEKYTPAHPNPPQRNMNIYFHRFFPSDCSSGFFMITTERIGDGEKRERVGISGTPVCLSPARKEQQRLPSVIPHIPQIPPIPPILSTALHSAPMTAPWTRWAKVTAYLFFSLRVHTSSTLHCDHQCWRVATEDALIASPMLLSLDPLDHPPVSRIIRISTSWCLPSFRVLAPGDSCDFCPSPRRSEKSPIHTLYTPYTPYTPGNPCNPYSPYSPLRRARVPGLLHDSSNSLSCPVHTHTITQSYMIIHHHNPNLRVSV